VLNGREVGFQLQVSHRTAIVELKQMVRPLFRCSFDALPYNIKSAAVSSLGTTPAMVIESAGDN
jgi:hypothetical protein